MKNKQAHVSSCLSELCLQRQKREPTRNSFQRNYFCKKLSLRVRALSPCIILIAIYLKIKDSFSSACQLKDSKEQFLYLSKEVAERATHCAVIIQFSGREMSIVRFVYYWPCLNTIHILLSVCNIGPTKYFL